MKEETKKKTYILFEICMFLILISFTGYLIYKMVDVADGMSPEKQRERAEEQYKFLVGKCEWGITQTSDYGQMWYDCRASPCKTLNTDGLNCTPNKVWVKGGFLSTGYYQYDVNCEGRGNLKESCTSWWHSRKAWEEYHNDTWHCMGGCTEEDE